MSNITVDFSKIKGKIRPMHAVNNGPSVHFSDIEKNTVTVYNSNFERFVEAGFPYVRTHDASFFPRYGLEHTVDVARIFSNFDADVDDPASYDFVCTDDYMRCCEAAGAKVFYRLGARIEHEIKKYNIFPPKDNKKWAQICEHIIRHYTEGWADGFHMDMEYWEIWNEPDLGWENPEKSPTWRGTKEEFFDLYEVASKYLKEKFPGLKIGGPAIAGSYEWTDIFLSEMQKRNVKMDFFSWHIYTNEIEKVAKRSEWVRELLDKYGYNDAESILNEWNYVLEWVGEGLEYSRHTHWNNKGASFNLAVMCEGQRTSCDMLMYYDARPTNGWNGLFDPLTPGKALKGFYPFVMFNKLYKLGEYADCKSDKDLHVCAATGNEGKAVMFTHYNDIEETETKNVTLNLKGFGKDSVTKAKWYLLDDNHNMEYMYEIEFAGDEFKWSANVPNYTSYMIEFTN